MADPIEVALPPGAYRVGTPRQASGRDVLADLCRWDISGAIRPIRGWLQRTTSAMTGVARALFTWRADNSTRFIAVGTEQKVYAVTQTAVAPSDITPVGYTAGDADATLGGGYGVGPYGEGTYGTPRVDNVSVQDATMVSFDNFGQFLVGISDTDQRPFEWQLNTGTPAAFISGAPTGTFVFTTKRNHLVVLAADGDSRKAAWSDAGDNTNFIATATNQAGDVVVQSTARLMCGGECRGEALVLSEAEAFLMTYIADPYIFDFIPVGDSCGAISRGCLQATISVAYWWGLNGFFRFDGGSVLKLECDVYDAVIGNLNATQRSKITSKMNALNDEVEWIFPSSGSTECDMKVVFNYRRGDWNVYPWSRTVGQDSREFLNPIEASADGYLYDHEVGFAYDRDPSFATGPLELAEGAVTMRVRKAIPDEGNAGDVALMFYARDWPDTSEASFGPFTGSSPIPLHFAGRAVRFGGTFTSVDQDTRWAPPRCVAMPGGKRMAA